MRGIFENGIRTLPQKDNVYRVRLLTGVMADFSLKRYGSGGLHFRLSCSKGWQSQGPFLRRQERLKFRVM